MNIKIAENLREFRRKRGNTQEELSSHLGISTQAVSKWERGEGYPDITLLPLIAAYYEKSVDELLGCGEMERNGRIEELQKQFMDKSREGRIEEAIALMCQALKDFPYQLSFMWNLAWALRFTRKEEYADECIALCEKILERSVDDEQRYLTLEIIVDAYGRKGNVEKAKKYADKLPGVTCSKGIVLESVLKGEECVKLSQQNIMTFVNLIDNCVMWMLHAGEYTAQERIFAYETVDKLYNLFLYDGNYGLENNALSMLWQNIAEEYAKCREEEKTISALKNAWKYTVAAEHLEAGPYTSIFADRGSYSEESVYRNNDAGPVSWMKEIMEKEAFDFIRETEAFRSIDCGFGGAVNPEAVEGR